MTWFKVDDKLHSHSKTRKVLAEAPAALALWVIAGSWSSDNLTDGLIPDHQLPWLIPVGAEDMARQLVAARLWRRVKGGYQFHEWAADADGTKRNPLRVEVEAERKKKADAGRKGGLASGKARSKNEAPASARASRVVQPPTRPSPSTKEKGSCVTHADAPSPTPENPNWRALPAFGAERHPADTDRARRGAAAAREALARPPDAEAS
jgi:general stress protein YciG